MYIGLHVKYPLFCPILMKLEFSGQLFEKYSNIKFHENPLSGSGVVPCGWTDTTKLIVAPHNFANSPKYSFKNHKRQNLRETSYEGTWFAFSLYSAVVILVFVFSKDPQMSSVQTNEVIWDVRTCRLVNTGGLRLCGLFTQRMLAVVYRRFATASRFKGQAMNLPEH